MSEFPCPVCTNPISLERSPDGPSSAVCQDCQSVISAIQNEPQGLSGRQWELFIADACAEFVGRICGTPGHLMPQEVVRATHNLMILMKSHENWLREREAVRNAKDTQPGQVFQGLRLVKGGVS